MKRTILFSAILSFAFISCGQQKSLHETTVDLSAPKFNHLSEATFAAGCFWCEEAIFESVKGVEAAISGYAGGVKPNPTYYDLGKGPTCHAEMVNVYYDSSKIDYPTLLKVYFSSQDPTQVNGQGPDTGAQYRSIVFYRNESEKQMAAGYIKNLNESRKYKNPVTVQLVAFTRFWEAEPEHQDFVKRHPFNPYVVHESIPRIQRFQELFPNLIKPDDRY